MKTGVSRGPMAPRDDVERRFILAREHYAAGRIEEAERSLRQVLKRAPKAPEALYLMGQIAARPHLFPEEAGSRGSGETACGSCRRRSS